MTNMTKAVIYARVSTTEQTLDNQTVALESWAKSRDIQVVGTYHETDSGWVNGHQAQLKQLMIDARHHKFEVVLVWALDRLSREGSAAILNIIDALGLYKVRVLSYQEMWTEAPGQLGELLFAIAGWVAKMESERRSERTLAGLDRARQQGKLLGRPVGAKDSKKRKRTGYLLRYAQ